MKEQSDIYENIKDDAVKSLFMKYRLVPDRKGDWYSKEENAHPHLIFTCNFIKKHDIFMLLFRIHKLCMAKVNYFRKEMVRYEPYKYDWKAGFVRVPLWDAEFFRHKNSGIFIDFRQLAGITDIRDFEELCSQLHTFDNV